MHIAECFSLYFRLHKACTLSNPFSAVFTFPWLIYYKSYFCCFDIDFGLSFARSISLCFTWYMALSCRVIFLLFLHCMFLVLSSSLDFSVFTLHIANTSRNPTIDVYSLYLAKALALRYYPLAGWFLLYMTVPSSNPVFAVFTLNVACAYQNPAVAFYILHIVQIVRISVYACRYNAI